MIIEDLYQYFFLPLSDAFLDFNPLNLFFRFKKQINEISFIKTTKNYDYFIAEVLKNNKIFFNLIIGFNSFHIMIFHFFLLCINGIIQRIDIVYF